MFRRPDGTSPVGNGAIVTWTTGSEDYERSLALVLIKNTIVYHEDAGRVEAVSLVPAAYVLRDNWFFDGDLVINSLVADYCVSGNGFLFSSTFVGGASATEPFYGGSFCTFCP